MLTTIARYSLREALQNRVLGLLLGLLLAGFLLAEFVGAVALTEQRAVQAALLGSLLRVGSVLIIALFVVASLLREQQDRTLELVLSLARPRGQYVAGKLLAYSALALMLALACGALVLLYAEALVALRWCLSLACELSLVAAFGLLLAFTFRQPVAALAALLAVYALTRALGALLLIAHESPFSQGGAFDAFAAGFLGVLGWLLPALYRFTQAGWLAYGTGSWGDFGLVVAQTAIYLPLLAAAAMFDLYRREW
jgi:ABC-type transport system involved in multi-copper enzyme maturation permease subunit